jgi:dihydrofolate reductase
MLRLIMAVSADGYLCRGPVDQMGWTGTDDKRLFRLLTTLGGRVLLAGKTTAAMLPPLPGRTVVPLSRSRSGEDGITLEEAVMSYPNAWLIGGPTVALEALKQGYVDEAVLCWSETSLHSGVPLRPLKAYMPTPTARVIMGRVVAEVTQWHGK